MSDLDHATSLLQMAEGDLNALRGMTSLAFEESRRYFTDEVFGFHAQQAAEKCLKAWIACLGERYARTHDLLALIETLDKAGEETAGLDDLVDLNSFAVQNRYEPLATDDEELDRLAIVREIESLLERVAQRLHRAQHPDVGAS